MAAEWLFQREGQWVGPFSGAQIQELAASGRLGRSDLVRRGADGKAIPAEQVKGLFNNGAVKERPAPPPPTLPDSQGCDKATGATTSKTSTRLGNLSPSKKVIFLSAVAGACFLVCCGGLGVIGIIIGPMKHHNAAQNGVPDKGSDPGKPPTEQDRLIAEVEAQAPPLPEFPESEYKYDYSKDDYTVPAGAKKETRKRVIKGGAEGLVGKPETTEGYIDLSGKWVEHGMFTTWTDDTQTKKLRDGKLLHGKLHGVMTFYYPNGQKRWEKLFVRDELHGIERWWHENGQLASISPYVQGKFHGKRQGWYDSGALAYDETYVHGDRHGVHKKWWKDGRLASIACLRKNVKHGKVWSQNEEGSLGETGEWEDGRPKGKCRFAFGGLDPHTGRERPTYYIEVSDEPWKGGTIEEFIARMYYFMLKDRPDLGLQFDPKMRIATYFSKTDSEFFARFAKPSRDVHDFEKAGGAPGFLRDQYRAWSYNCRDGVLKLRVQPSQSGNLMVTAHWRDNPVPALPGNPR